MAKQKNDTLFVNYDYRQGKDESSYYQNRRVQSGSSKSKKVKDTSTREYAYRLEENDGMFYQNHRVKTDSSRNYIKARKRSNRRAGWGLFFTVILGLAMFAASIGLFYTLWTDNAKVTDIVKDIFSKVKPISDVEPKMICYIISVNIFNILACFAFRRGSTKGFACFLYLVGLALCIGFAYIWLKDYTDPVFITAAAYALLSFIVLVRGKNKGDFFPEDSHKHNPRVWWRYFVLAVFNIFYVALVIIGFIFKIIFRLIRGKKKKAETQYI